MLFDAVAIIPSREGGAKLATQAEAVNFLRDAFGHLKVIAYLADRRAADWSRPACLKPTRTTTRA